METTKNMEWINFVMSEQNILEPPFHDIHQEWFRLWYSVFLGYLNFSYCNSVIKIKKKFIKKAMLAITGIETIQYNYHHKKNENAFPHLIHTYTKQILFKDSMMSESLMKELNITPDIIEKYTKEDLFLSPTYVLVFIINRFFNNTGGFFNFLTHCKWHMN
ncbi:hypothetical protein [Salmon gill poxvirus]